MAEIARSSLMSTDGETLRFIACAACGGPPYQPLEDAVTDEDGTTTVSCPVHGVVITRRSFGTLNLGIVDG